MGARVIHAGPIDSVTLSECGGSYVLLETGPRQFAFLRPEEARELADVLYQFADKHAQPMWSHDPEQLTVLPTEDNDG